MTNEMAQIFLGLIFLVSFYIFMAKLLNKVCAAIREVWLYYTGQIPPVAQAPADEASAVAVTDKIDATDELVYDENDDLETTEGAHQAYLREKEEKMAALRARYKQ